MLVIGHQWVLCVRCVEVCISCGGSKVIDQHPLFCGGVCRECRVSCVT